MADGPTTTELRFHQRMLRSRVLARMRHRMGWWRRCTGAMTRMHAATIRLSGGRMRRSYLFTGGLPALVLTTMGRRTGKSRSVPLGFVRSSEDFVVMASNAGNDRVPGWWLNLQADPTARILADRTRYTVRARRADPAENDRSPSCC
jgi:deazaflavin-dependent oxidoreductase (nitroreductase family)